MKKRKQPTQLARALGALDVPLTRLRSLENQLWEVIREAQNQPPQGEADGTLDERTWTALRDLAEAATRLLTAHETATYYAKHRVAQRIDEVLARHESPDPPLYRYDLDEDS